MLVRFGAAKLISRMTRAIQKDVPLEYSSVVDRDTKLHFRVQMLNATVKYVPFVFLVLKKVKVMYTEQCKAVSSTRFISCIPYT